jgi:OmpA-OmpF porin, OOP family
MKLFSRLVSGRALARAATKTESSKEKRALEIWRTLARSSSARGVGVLIAAVVLGHLSSASAQDVVGNEFSGQRYSPAAGPRNFLSTRGARTDGEMAWSGGLSLNYANTPIKVESCVSDTPGSCNAGTETRTLKVIENLVQADFMGTLTPIPRLQLALRVPIGFAKGNGIDDNADAAPVSKFGMPDPELEAKFRIYGEVKDPVVAGVAVYATAPTGHLTAPHAYLGDETPSGGIRAIFDGESGPLSFGVNLGGVLRGEGRLDKTIVGSEMRYSAAVGYRPSPIVRILVDAFGSTRFTSAAGENALEVDAAAQLSPSSSPFGFQVGGGIGAIQGLGVPVGRVLLAGTYTFEKHDRDNDGVDDSVDQCPTEPEDRDGYEDADGCPDPDNDLDTIPDKADKCPNQAEDMDGFEDTDGCPDLDNDKDGIPDTQDRCPNQPETKNGFEDADGCPDQPDRDHDGVPDDKDKCPDDPEDTDGFEDTDGCPDPDNDKDGIPDDQDECVDEPENFNHFEDQDGCPDDPKQKTQHPKKEKKGAPPPAQQPAPGKVLEL